MLRLPSSLIAFLVMAMTGLSAPSQFGAVTFSIAADNNPSTGGVYSITRTTGIADFTRMRGAGYTVAGSFSPGTILMPELAAGGFYLGIDLHDPLQAAADYDGDGLSNLTEYALGTDPRNAADSTQGLLIILATDSGAQYLTMQFKRRTNASGLGLQYLPEVSADGNTWFADATHILELGSTAFDNQFDWVTVRDLTPTTSIAPRFIRLRIRED